jgi:hypothetical protein
MADTFISFKTEDTLRVQAFYDGFRARGRTVFWCNDILKGEIRRHHSKPGPRQDPTRPRGAGSNPRPYRDHNSVGSQPVAQECEQAAQDKKLFQVVLDEIRPIHFPMGAGYLAQKTKLLGWTGDRQHPEWVKHNKAIDARVGQHQMRNEGRICVDAAITHNSNGKWFIPGAGKTEWFQDHAHGPEWWLCRLAA